MRKTLIFVAFFAMPAAAQVEQDILEDLRRDFGGVEAAPQRGPVTSVPRQAATLRGLDKMTGLARDIDVTVGETVEYERLTIRLDACRSPAAGEKPDAYAFVEIVDRREDAPRFSGWMIASSPALNALDHPRYDVWVTSCGAGDTG